MSCEIVEKKRCDIWEFLEAVFNVMDGVERRNKEDVEKVRGRMEIKEKYFGKEIVIKLEIEEEKN